MRLQPACSRRTIGIGLRRLAAVALGLLIAGCDDSTPVRPRILEPRFAINSAGAPFSIEFFLQAHEDDWQIFLGDRVASSVQTANKAVLLYVTAGDAGTVQSNPAFWHAREDAAKASMDAMVPGTWACGNATVNAHTILRCAKGTIVAYFLRLPDGGGDGSGLGFGSLTRLQSGSISSLSADDGSTRYSSWSDLVATVRAIVASEAAGQSDPNIALHTTDWNTSNNPGDHADHLATGALLRDAAAGHSWNLFWYLGYPNIYQSPNVLPGTQPYTTKWNLILAYDNVMKAEMGETIIGTSHTEDWAQRTIFRSELSPLPPPPVNPPAAPGALQGSASSSVQIDLAWTDNSVDEQGFRIERAPDVNGAAGTYAEIGTVTANVTTYASTGLTGNTRYWYRVRAYNSGGASSYSNEVSATTPIPPAAPTQLTATAVSATRIDLTWADNSSDEQGFRIERAPDVSGAAGTYAEIATVGSGITSYSNTGVSGSTKYWYRVRSYNAIGPSAYSNQATATTPAVPPPTAPTNLVATAASITSITLTWSDNSSDEQGFRIERAPDQSGSAGTYAEIAVVAAGTTTFSSTALTANTRYWYRVRAYNAVGTSAYSNAASATTLPPPPSSFALEFYFQGHEDDWQIFFGNRVATSVQSGIKVVLVYVTAGDAGTANSNPPFWQARQAAADASVDLLTTGTRLCDNPSVNGHSIMRCTKANTVSYYLRLPDGGGNGQGAGYGSIELLQSGSTSSLRAVDGSTTYASWTDLVSTTQSIVTSEQAGQSDINVALHTTDWSSASNAGDHPDHMTTGQLLRSASVGHTYNLFWYLGYPSIYQPANVLPGTAAYTTKWNLIVAYDNVMKARMGETIIGTSHTEDWAQRTIYRQ